MRPVVRPVQAHDCAAIHAIFMSDHVINGTMRTPYQSLATTARRLEPSEEVVKLVACSDDATIGYAELITYPQRPRYRHAAEISMLVVHKDWQRQGVGQALMEAMLDLTDNWLQVSRVSLTVWRSNEAAIELYQKCGFLIEGVMRKYVFREGMYEDACTMARIRP